MKAEELRIGNWIGYNGTPVLVDSGTIRNMHLMGEHHQYLPIELSPEILEKAGADTHTSGGFKYSRKPGSFYVYYNKNGYISSIEIGGILVDNIRLLSDYKLHHFQNLFYLLTGSELPINL